MLNAIKRNPIRIYAVVAASVALVAHYAPDLPEALVLALVSAILGIGGEVTASKAAKVGASDPSTDPSV